MDNKLKIITVLKVTQISCSKDLVNNVNISRLRTMLMLFIFKFTSVTFFYIYITMFYC